MSKIIKTPSNSPIMGRIDTLVNELCPEGLEKVPLWEITAWDKRFNAVDKSMQKKIIKYNYFLAKELDDLVDNSGDIRILYTTEDIAYTTEEKADGKISEGEVVAIPWGGNPTVKYFNGRFVTGDNRIATSLDKSRLDNKYLYYWMLGQLDVIGTFYRGAGIKHPSMFSVLTMEIPLPSLSIQQKIVSVLDSFTTLIDKMKQEVEKRKKQMEYYREKLLTFEDCEANGCHVLDILSQPITDGPHETPKFQEHGIPFISVDAIVNNEIDFNKKRGFISAEYDELCSKKYKPKKNDVYVVKSGSTVGKVAIVKTDSRFNIWSPLAALRTNCENNAKFLFYLLQTNSVQQEIRERSSNGSQPNLSMRALEKINIKIPPLSKQSEIVSTLDKFESYITKLEKMITLRQKQYEYYREQLLTFRSSPALP